MVAVALDPVADAGTYTATAAEILSRRVLYSTERPTDDSKTTLCVTPSLEQQPESPIPLPSTSSVSTASPWVTPPIATEHVPASGDCSRTDSPITLCTTPSAPTSSPAVTHEVSSSAASPDTLAPMTTSTEDAPETGEVASVVRFDQMMRLALQKTFGDNVPKHLEDRVLRIAAAPSEEVSRQTSRRTRLRSPSTPSSALEVDRRVRSSSQRRRAHTSPSPGRQTSPSPMRAVCVGTSVALGSTATPSKGLGATQASARRRSPTPQQSLRPGSVFARLLSDAKDRQQRKSSDSSEEISIFQEQLRCEEQYRKNSSDEASAPKATRVPDSLKNSWKDHQRKASDGREDVSAPKAHKVPSSSKATIESQLRSLDARCNALASEISQSVNAMPESRDSSRDKEKRLVYDPTFHERLFSEAQEWKVRRMQLVEEHAVVEQDRLKREAAQALKGTADKQRHFKRYPSPRRQVGFIEKLLKYRSDADAIAGNASHRFAYETKSTPQAKTCTDVSCSTISDADVTSTAATITSAISLATSSNGFTTYPVSKQKDSCQRVDSVATWDSASSPSAEDKSRQDILVMKRQLGLLLLNVDVLKRRVDQYEGNTPCAETEKQDQACSGTAHFVAPLEQLDPLPESPLLANARGNDHADAVELDDIIQDVESLEHILASTMAGMDAAAKLPSIASDDQPTRTSSKEAYNAPLHDSRAA